MVTYKQLILLNASNPIVDDPNKLIPIVSRCSSEYLLKNIKNLNSIPVGEDNNTRLLISFNYELFFKWIKSGQDMDIQYYNGNISIPDFPESVKVNSSMEHIKSDSGDTIGYMFMPSSPRVNSNIIKKIKWKLNVSNEATDGRDKLKGPSILKKLS